MCHHFNRIGEVMRFGASRIRQVAAPFIALNLLVISVLFSPGRAWGDIFQNTGPTPFGDDEHRASVIPFKNGGPIPVSSITYLGHPNLNGQCTWINTALRNFIAAKATPGQAWKFSWAGVKTEQKVEAGIKILDYKPFVVTPPKVTDAAGNVYKEGKSGELGGAVLNLSYTPTAANGAPVLNNMEWIQAYTGDIYGKHFGPILDNNPNGPYVSQLNNTTPFYGPHGPYAGGVYGNKNQNAFFVDRPQVPEREYEKNPVVRSQFQVILATDKTSKINNGKTTLNTITLYGGEWWGFSYSAKDIPPPPPVPEPSTLLLAVLGGSGLLICRRRTRAA